jgi:hypothetical protein
MLARFTGPVRKVDGPGPKGITLLGLLEDADPIGPVPAQLSLIGTEHNDLPDQIDDLWVEELAGSAVMLRGGAREWQITCRTLQLHRDVGVAFYAAVPPRATPWTRRVTWRMLLGIAATAPGRWLLSRRSRVA